MRAVPGDPLAKDKEGQMNEAIREKMREHYGLGGSQFEQYARGLWGVVTLNLGPSLKHKDYTVNQIIAQGLPRSLALGTVALIFALVLGLTAGMVSAVRRGGFLDTSLMMLATIGIALPNFVIASVLILVLVFWLGLFPAAGWGGYQFVILPAFCLGAPFAAYIARLTRSGMLDILSQDYIRTARAKGLSEFKVIWGHAFKGGLLPVLSFLGPAIAGILTGSLVIEKIFAIPGLGTYFVQSALNRDYFLSMGCVLFYTTLVYCMNVIVDIGYTLIDPRVELE